MSAEESGHDFLPEKGRRLAILAIAWLLAAALAIQLAVSAFAFVQKAGAGCDNSYPESALAERALALARGERLFPETRQWPYNIAVYGPLTYAAPGFLLRAWGLPVDRAGQASHAFVAGRAQSLLAVAALLAGIWVLAGMIGLEKRWRWFAAGLFFCSPEIIKFGYSFRPDAPAVALSLWAWILALRARRPLGAFGPAALLTAAVFVKQNSLISAAALFVCLLIERRRAFALCFAALLAAFTGAGAILLTALAGRAWLDNTVFALASPMYWNGFAKLLLELPFEQTIPLAGAFAACLGVVWNSGKARTAQWAFPILLLAAMASSCRTGGEYNYFLESYCWAVVLAASCLRRLASDCGPRLPSPGTQRVWIAVLLSILLLPAARVALFSLYRFRDIVRPTVCEAAQYPGLKRILNETRGEVLLSRSHLFWETQSPPTIMDLLIYSQRVAMGGVPLDGLLGRIERRQFELIVLHWNIAGETPVYQRGLWLPAPAAEAIRRLYHPAGEFGALRLYRPNKPDNQQDSR